MNTTSEILLEFEKRISEAELSVGTFLRELPDGLDDASILALVGVATEKKLKTGKVVEPPEIHADLSDLPKRKINEVLAESISNFVQSYCPVTDRVGAMPVEHNGYRFECELGRGGTGVVYEAEQLGMNRKVAIKVLFSATNNTSAEANILSRIVHPNVCVVYDVGLIDGLVYISMQKIKGDSLKRFCKNPPNLSIDRALKITIDILDAIAECHGRGIVHWDLKPGNIMISDDKPVLVDFGLARHTVVNDPMVSGSPKYMAPEMLSGDPSDISPTMCDVYSVGVILYLMLTGHLPYPSAGGEANFARRPSDFRPEIDDELDRLVLDAIEIKPFDRIPTASRFQAALKNCQKQTLADSDEGGVACKSIPLAHRLAGKSNETWQRLVVVILSLLLAVVSMDLFLTIWLLR